MLIKMDDGKANGEAAIERSGHSDSDQISSSLSHSFRERDLEIELGKGEPAWGVVLVILVVESYVLYSWLAT